MRNVRGGIVPVSSLHADELFLAPGAPSPAMELSESLRNFLESGEDWERKNTNVKGVSLIKLPKTRSRPASLAIEINPVTDKGTPMKKKGVMLMGSFELTAFREIFNNPKLDVLLTTLEEIAPGRKPQKTEEGGVLEI